VNPALNVDIILDILSLQASIKFLFLIHRSSGYVFDTYKKICGCNVSLGHQHMGSQTVRVTVAMSGQNASLSVWADTVKDRLVFLTKIFVIFGSKAQPFPLCSWLCLKCFDEKL
jgi:hypothetical protein